MSKLIKFENLKNSDGKPITLAIQDGRFVDPSLSGGDSKDCGGLTAIPGLVDLHTHLREPGYEDAETIFSGSQAAAAGGYTAVSAMPNTDPIADTAGVVEQIFRLGASHAICDVFPIGAITVGSRGEQLAELRAMNASAAKTRIFSDDGKCLSNALLMRRALEYVKSFNGIIAQHAQDPELTIDSQVNEGVISARLGLKGWPAVAEEAIIARDVLLAEHVGSKLHICHVSTAGSVEIIRWAKERGIQVTAEVTPHHLLLTEDLVISYDPVFKVNPPLRTIKDVEALREGLVDGTIDVIATDHAPHPAERKECEWASAAFGMLGLESALSVSYKAMVETKLLTLTQLIDRMSNRPAKIAGYVQHGLIEIGRDANFALIDLESARSTGRRMSKSANDPYRGMELPVRVNETYLRGNLVNN
jgi:dihydroorotase